MASIKLGNSRQALLTSQLILNLIYFDSEMPFITKYRLVIKYFWIGVFGRLEMWDLHLSLMVGFYNDCQYRDCSLFLYWVFTICFITMRCNQLAVMGSTVFTPQWLTCKTKESLLMLYKNTRLMLVQSSLSFCFILNQSKAMSFKILKT
jgi:hypothetical protein